MSLFLTGGGDQECFADLDRKFKDLFKKASSVGILAQASDHPDDALERLQDCFSTSLLSGFSLISDANKDLNEFDALMIEGGNTFQLIKAIRESTLNNKLIAFFKSGRPIYADSAGAIILGSDIQTAFLGEDSDEDADKIQDYRGLDLISPWCVHAHAEEGDNENLQDLLYEKGHPILALSENCGILIKDETIEVLGQDRLIIFTFNGKISLRPGQKKSFKELQGL